MKMILRALSLVGFISLVGCAHGNCHSQQKNQMKKDAGSSAMTNSKASERVKVSKSDGSLQCNQGKKIPLADMQKDLGTIQVFSSQNLNDGLMRIQKCGSPTGLHNVYEIDKKDLEAALAAGFKEWLVD